MNNKYYPQCKNAGHRKKIQKNLSANKEPLLCCAAQYICYEYRYGISISELLVKSEENLYVVKERSVVWCTLCTVEHNFWVQDTEQNMKNNA